MKDNSIDTEVALNELEVINKDVISAKTAKLFLDQTIQFQNLMIRYNSAIREVRTKLEVLNDDLAMRNNHSPIENISHRVKKPMSIFGKLERLDKDISVDSISKNLNDVAGIRVICSFIEDIYSVAHMLAIQDDITVIETKDYIKNPKPNGYRSYHMIVEVPVFFSDYKRPMRVEVQFRTVAMDFWARLEHQLRYKKNIANEAEIVKRLTDCAEVIASVDVEMQSIKKEIGNDIDDETNMVNQLDRLSSGIVRPFG